ncbi:MAG TPA: barstar family protein [Gemmataceae bacterium]|nr:barstar family protein [Gemmataceae bacterium]
MTIIRIDARRLTDAAGLHVAMSEAIGFPATYGKNLDALVDCLTHLDDLKAGMSRVQVMPGEVAVLVIEHTTGLGKKAAEQVKSLTDAVAFVNWRRLERGQPAVLAMAYERL